MYPVMRVPADEDLQLGAEPERVNGTLPEQPLSNVADPVSHMMLMFDQMTLKNFMSASGCRYISPL